MITCEMTRTALAGSIVSAFARGEVHHVRSGAGLTLSRRAQHWQRRLWHSCKPLHPHPRGGAQGWRCRHQLSYNTKGDVGALAAAVSAQGMEDPSVGVVIVDHGSRRAESNEMLQQFAQLYQEVTGRDLVEIAHMELAQPTIEQAMSKCVERGASKVIVAPYFLSRGRHIQEDIPALVAAAQEKLPGGVECVIAEPIGIDGLMAQLIENRVRAAASAGASSQA